MGQPPKGKGKGKDKGKNPKVRANPTNPKVPVQVPNKRVRAQDETQIRRRTSIRTRNATTVIVRGIPSLNVG